MRMVLYGDPKTKKNSQRIIRAGRFSRILPSKAYEDYANSCLTALKLLHPPDPISQPINLKCVYYMRTRRRVDLVNLLEATCDILVSAGVLEDDNSGIVAGHDGSRVDYDKDNPRVEIEIMEVQREQQN